MTRRDADHLATLLCSVNQGDRIAQLVLEKIATPAVVQVEVSLLLPHHPDLHCITPAHPLLLLRPPPFSLWKQPSAVKVDSATRAALVQRWCRCRSQKRHPSRSMTVTASGDERKGDYYAIQCCAMSD